MSKLKVYPQRRECLTCRKPFVFIVPIRRLYCSPKCVPDEVAERIKAAEESDHRDYSWLHDEIGNAPRCCWKWDPKSKNQARVWKKRYFTRKEAEAEDFGNTGENLNIYTCNYCGYFHLGRLYEHTYTGA